MKYLKKYESFYNEDFKEIKENFDKIEFEEDEEYKEQQEESSEMLVDEMEMETEEASEEMEDTKDCGCDDGKLEEGFKKFFTGHDGKGDRDETMLAFHKALDDAEEMVNKNPKKYVFNRESLEKKAKENNYKGGLRIQKGGRDKSRTYVVYDSGLSGLQAAASGASTGRGTAIGT